VQLNGGVELGTFNEAEKAVHEFCQKNYHAIHVDSELTIRNANMIKMYAVLAFRHCARNYV